MTTKKFSLLLEAVYNRSVLRPYRPEDSGTGDALDKSSADDHAASEQESKSSGRGDPSDKKGVDSQSRSFGKKTEKQGEKEKQSGDGTGDGSETGNTPGDPSSMQSSKGGDRSGQSTIKKQQPSFNWKVLIKQALLKSFKHVTEETRAKYSRRTVSQIGVLQSKKAAAVMPGEKIDTIPDLKIAFVLDVSGSMSSYYSKCMTEIYSVMTGKDLVGASCTFITYASDVELFFVDLVKKQGRQINELKERKPIGGAGSKPTIPINNLLFKANVGGGTDLTNDTLRKHMAELLTEGPVILMTDDDACYNIQYLKQLLESPNFMLILSDKGVYDRFVTACGGSISRTRVTHF